MNILFFLKPKSEVAFIYDYSTLRQVLETMEFHKYYEAVSADADMEDLLQKAMNQNFVPVVDDQKKFIGIITRKSIIEYCYEKIKKLDEPY